MSQETLIFVVLSVFGVYGVRYAQRLAPLNSELPLKTLLATLLAALAAGLGVAGVRVTPPLFWLAATLGPVYIFAPFVVTALARGRLYSAATGFSRVLYWSPSGRNGMARLVAQVALNADDPEVALGLLPPREGDVLRLQAYALSGHWHDVLNMPLPEGRDNALLGRAARIEALLALGQEADAEASWGSSSSTGRAGVRGRSATGP